MSKIRTRYFGDLDCPDDARLHFTEGLPGFETERWFVLLEQPQTKPLVFLQSLSDPQLCFISLPVQLVDPDFDLSMSADDREALGLGTGRQPRIGEEVLCLALVTLSETHPPTGNLLAPVVIHLKTREALQAIQTGSSYSHRQPITPSSLEPVCS
ncbi:MAG: flagellar assembly protein FliW [Bryobacteraceae bacterium]